MRTSEGRPGRRPKTYTPIALLVLCVMAWAFACAADPVEPPKGVCPPFQLRDEQGNVINPVTGENAGVPYSPKQTCGQCHDYDLITEGFHFTQGAGEEPTPDQAARCQWVSTPGNYGGTWCSPAPLYLYLSKKHNESPAEMDMTSFSFLTAGCAVCHPGGGSAEYDREGKRYDRWMADPASGFTPGGDNNFDGDYYRAKWSESGVLEADCLLCHLPEYDFKARNKQLDALNFRWAPSVGAGLATVSGSVAEGEPVSVAYNVSKFGEDGTLSPHIVREPRTETCLTCHAKPGWKKRGANFRARTDVHLRAGLKCVDCHPAGSLALDERIHGKEVHQFGKGDDPGEHVRDDLDNTMRDCADCHDTGYLGAPVAKHRGLPPLHLDKIACQTCHIPERAVKAALTVASDVFNPGAKIPDPGKHLWTFYGPDMAYWNHYGDLEMMGYDDKPTNPYRPVLARYDGKIYPVNRIHNTWPAIETEGKDALHQPKMGAVYKMWTAHQKDPATYPSLALITDDNGDGVIEVNRAEEIDALIAAITEMLRKTGYPMEGKRVVWVMNDRVYRSGTEYRTVPMHTWEASPYANVHKYSHDVYPATAALGSNGCTDCHSPESEFFFASVVKYPFDENAQPVEQPQYRNLEISRVAAVASGWREWFLKPFGIWAVAGTCIILVLHLTLFGVRRVPDDTSLTAGNEVVRFSRLERLAHFVVMVSFIGLAATGFSFLFGESSVFGHEARWLHGWLGWLFALGLLGSFFCWASDMLYKKGDETWIRAFGGYFWESENLPAGKFNAGQKIFFWLSLLFGVVLVATGGVLFFRRENMAGSLSLWYTAHDLAAVLLLPAGIAHFYLAIIANLGAANSIFGGRVKKAWLERHHPHWTRMDT